MAHEIETMMYVNEIPWHRLGVRLDTPPTIADAIRCAGLDWEVGMQSLYTSTGHKVDARATYRVSDGKVLGVVGMSYQPLQNAKAFDFFDPFLSAGEASLETAGSLREGKRIWILAKMNRTPSVIVPRADDVVEKYILLSNSHDGTLSARVGFTPIRVVCANTLAMATRNGASKLIRVRHQRNVADTLAQVRDIMNTANASFEATADQYRRLAARSVNEKDLKRYVQQVFAPHTVKEAAAPRRAPLALPPANGNGLGLVRRALPASTEVVAEIVDDDAERSSRVYDAVRELFETGRGNDLVGVRGTVWAAYNAVTEYLAHQRGKDEAKRLDGMWFGGGAVLNQRALDAASALAA